MVPCSLSAADRSPSGFESVAESGRARPRADGTHSEIIKIADVLLAGPWDAYAHTAGIRPRDANNGGKSLLNDLVEHLHQRFSCERGVTAVEYAIMVSLIAVVIVAAVTAVGTSLNTLFETAAEAIPG